MLMRPQKKVVKYRTAKVRTSWQAEAITLLRCPHRDIEKNCRGLYASRLLNLVPREYS